MKRFLILLILLLLLTIPGCVSKPKAEIVLPVIFSLGLCILLSPIILPILRHFHIKQSISSFVGIKHIKKQGTPTMGGLIFIVPTLLATIILLLTGRINYTSNLGIVLLVFIGYALIGFLDDFISGVL